MAPTRLIYKEKVAVLYTTKQVKQYDLASECV